MKKLLYILIAIISLNQEIKAQSSLQDSVVNGMLLSAHFGVYTPYGDLKSRFGQNGLIGGELNYKTLKNFTYGVEASFFYGRNVKDDAFLDSLYSDNDQLIGYTGTIANVALFERGFTLEAKAGKLFPIKALNPNSGIMVNVGVGLMQHKIKISDIDDVVIYLKGDYAKGYDKLSNGLMLTQSIMFINLDKKHLLNFKVGLEVKEAFTQNRRNWNFDERLQDSTQRLDIIAGIKLSWLVPFYSKNEERFYSY